jgi:hypothetical protein
MLDFLRDTAHSKALSRLELGRPSSVSSAVSSAIPAVSSAIPKVAAWGLPRLFRSAPPRRSAPAIGAMAAGPAVLLVLAGAACMYLFDPDRGLERRAQARQYLSDLWTRGRVALGGPSDTSYRGVYAPDRRRDPNDQFAGI